MGLFNISQRVQILAKASQSELTDVFSHIDSVAESCTAKVMSAFQEFRVSEACFAGTTGYGYDD
ncbi:MAG: methionine gamma-lyase family protein, partial [Oscillospiraceae bacterium]